MGTKLGGVKEGQGVLLWTWPAFPRAWALVLESLCLSLCCDKCAPVEARHQASSAEEKPRPKEPAFCPESLAPGSPGLSLDLSLPHEQSRWGRAGAFSVGRGWGASAEVGTGRGICPQMAAEFHPCLRSCWSGAGWCWRPAPRPTPAVVGRSGLEFRVHMDPPLVSSCLSTQLTVRAGRGDAQAPRPWWWQKDRTGQSGPKQTAGRWGWETLPFLELRAWDRLGTGVLPLVICERAGCQ